MLIFSPCAGEGEGRFIFVDCGQLLLKLSASCQLNLTPATDWIENQW